MVVISSFDESLRFCVQPCCCIVCATAEEAAAPAAAPAAARRRGARATAAVDEPDVIKAAVAINMTDAQKPEFNKVVGEYVTDHFAMIQKEMKRGAPNLDMTIRSKDNGARPQDGRQGAKRS